jgi:hypothetical protein
MAYDDSRFQDRIMFPVVGGDGVAVPGTAAADVVLARVRIPRAILIDEGTITLLVGGTSAGKVVALGKSLAGTGAVVHFSSYSVTTAADGVAAALTVTETEFDAGDQLILTNIAGTVASTPTVQVTVGWREDFDG